MAQVLSCSCAQNENVRAPQRENSKKQPQICKIVHVKVKGNRTVLQNKRNRENDTGKRKIHLTTQKMKGKMVVFVCLGLEIVPLCNEENDDP